MNLTISIQINKKRFSVIIKKRNIKSLKLVEKTEKSLEALSTNNEFMASTILSRNLKHLDFIDQLQIGLNKTGSKNFLLSKELNNIKRLAQINILEYLTKVEV